MNIMNKLTLKHIKKNKAKTIVTIIGIIISVAMLTAVTAGMKSGLQWFRNGEIEETGKWHAQFDGISLEQFQMLTEMSGMEEEFATKELGYAALDEPLDENRPYVYVRAYDNAALHNMPIKVIEGRLPENDTEIILSKDMVGTDGDALKIGDTVTYALGERFLKETGNEGILSTYGIFSNQELTQHNQYLDGTTELYSMGVESSDTTTASEELRITEEGKSYTVVGFIERPSYNEEPFSAPGYSAYTYLDVANLTEADTINGYCYYKTVTQKIYDKIADTAGALGLGGATNVNDRVLYYEAVSPDRGFTAFIRTMYVILISIIVMGSVSLIYNSFAISISERSKQLGMLASVGATKKQKRDSVLFEAFIYGIIGIPLGILAGLIGLSIAFKVVSGMIMSSFHIGAPLVLVISIKSIVASAVLATITIFISAYLPARKASKISPIQAIRQTTDIVVKEKKVRVSWISKKLFGFEGELAVKNMKRNRKRYRSIIVSLVISVVLFISVSAYLQYVTGAYFMAKQTSNYDIALYIYGESRPDKNDQTANIVSDIERINGVTDITLTSTVGFQISNEEVTPYLSEEMKADIQRSKEEQRVEESFAYSPYLTVQRVDDASFDSYCKNAGIDPKTVRSMKNGVVLLNIFEQKANYKIKRIPILSIEEGKVLHTMEETIKETVGLSIAGTSTELPIGIDEYPSSYYSNMTAIAPESSFDSIYQEMVKANGEEIVGIGSTVYISATDDIVVEKQLEAVMKANNYSDYEYNSYNVAQQDRANRELVYSVSIFAYGFIILMSMICCANMCNTISTSIALRRREFAMLKSVGMTPKRFHRMIRFESLLYGVKALVYGIPISFCISYVLYRYVVSRFTVSFLLPWYLYATVAVLVFGVVGIAMVYSSRKIRKENIIDGLKNEIC